MRRVLLLFACAACTPDFAHTAFLCTATADCPSEQTCLAGRCRRAPIQGDGIRCGASSCAAGQQCCVDGAGPHCLAADQICSGLGALCDGDEDCGGGDHCCDDGIVACNTSCATVVCLDLADCPDGRKQCCFDGATPWGTCSKQACP